MQERGSKGSWAERRTGRRPTKLHRKIIHNIQWLLFPNDIMFHTSQNCNAFYLIQTQKNLVFNFICLQRVPQNSDVTQSRHALVKCHERVMVETRSLSPPSLNDSLSGSLESLFALQKPPRISNVNSRLKLAETYFRAAHCVSDTSLAEPGKPHAVIGSGAAITSETPQALRQHWRVAGSLAGGGII